MLNHTESDVTPQWVKDRYVDPNGVLPVPERATMSKRPFLVFLDAPARCRPYRQFFKVRVFESIVAYNAALAAAAHTEIAITPAIIMDAVDARLAKDVKSLWRETTSSCDEIVPPWADTTYAVALRRF